MSVVPGAGLEDALAGAPDVPSVRGHLEALVARCPEVATYEGDRARAVVAVVAASRSLQRLLERDATAREVLVDLDHRPARDDRSPPRLREWKDRELLRLAARDLLGIDDLAATVLGLSALADDVLAGAVDLVQRSEGDVELAVIAMGKLGGDELNYASDVDVLFVGDGPPRALDAAARQVMDVVRPCFRIDANLRPEGRNGPLVRTIDSYESYWDRWARPWELQALLKARAAAGDPVLGQRFIDTAGRWLWHHPLDADDLRELRSLRARSEATVARRGAAERDIKGGPGGLRDIEFAVQLLQLVHGQLDPDLRTTGTLAALERLSRSGYVAPDDASTFEHAYRRLRTIEHRLQLVEERQTHALPADDDARTLLARGLGYRDRADATALAAFDHDVRRLRGEVRSIHERIWFRPLLEAFATSDAALGPDAIQTRLSAFGFTDTARTAAAVRELTRGMTRTSRLMAQFLPLLLDWLSASADPDLGLLVLRNLMGGSGRSVLTEAFRESPEAARRLCLLVGTSRLLGEIVGRNPDLVPSLTDDDNLTTRPREHLVDGARLAGRWRREAAERQRALHRWKEREVFAVAAGDVLGLDDVEQVGRDLTAIAESVAEVALEHIAPALPVAVVGLGRFGGAALGYGSDLDLVLAFEGSGAADAAEATRVAQELVRTIGGHGSDRIYAVDTTLRPEGRHGALARSVEAYAAYFERWAEVWERQAFIRARHVAGDVAVTERLLDAIAPHVWAELTDGDLRAIRRMKARIERERIPAGEDAQFHLKLGRGSLSDVEFTVQLSQLRAGVRETGTLTALGVLADTGTVSPEDAMTLAEAYEFCEATRNRLYLVGSGPADALPTGPEQLRWLARSLDTSPTELRERYRKVTRRARRVVERVFYGSDGDVA